VPTDTVLRERLTPEQYRVVREGGTQTPFQNEFWNNDRTGIYVDIITGEPLFTSLDKLPNSLGMVSFSKPISKDLVIEVPDNSHDMQRTEVRAKRSNAHLGHLIADPTSPTGQRYSCNSACFRFIPTERMKFDGYETYLPLVEKK
jgi:peptide methionine sulfoxide reductase msrA/msrB